MKRPTKKRGTLGLLSVMLFSCAEEANQETVAKQTFAIVGGNEAWLDSAVALTTSQCQLAANNPAICSGLLISPTVVITARHCVSYPVTTNCPNGISPSQWSTFSVAVGCQDIVNGCPPANWKGLASAPVIYPGSDHDIAILHLAQAVTVKPTRLTSPARLAEIAAGNLVTLTGWGATAANGPMSAVLRSVARPIWSIPLNEPGLPIQAQTFGTTCGQNPYVGSEHGDSGGPTLVLRDGEWFTLGVMQGGAYGTSWTAHGLVPYYFNWILSQASDFPAQSSLPSAQIAAITAILG